MTSPFGRTSETAAAFEASNADLFVSSTVHFTLSLQPSSVTGVRAPCRNVVCTCSSVAGSGLPELLRITGASIVERLTAELTEDAVAVETVAAAVTARVRRQRWRSIADERARGRRRRGCGVEELGAVPGVCGA